MGISHSFLPGAWRARCSAALAKVFDAPAQRARSLASRASKARAQTPSGTAAQEFDGPRLTALRSMDSNSFDSAASPGLRADRRGRAGRLRVVRGGDDVESRPQPTRHDPSSVPAIGDR